MSFFSPHIFDLKTKYNERPCHISDASCNERSENFEMSKLRPRIKRVRSCPQLQVNLRMEMLLKDSKEERKLCRKSIESNEPNFSLIHSNFLYLMFLLGFFASFGGDIMMQWAKNGDVSKNTKAFMFIFAINIFLWIDFNCNFSKKLKSHRRQGCLCETFLQDSTHLLFCIILAPIILIIRWFRLGSSSKYKPRLGSKDHELTLFLPAT